MERNRVGALHHNQVRDEARTVLAVVACAGRRLRCRDVLPASAGLLLLYVFLAHEVAGDVLVDRRLLAVTDGALRSPATLGTLLCLVGHVVDHSLALELLLECRPL